ncbi:MAG TPA: hypothetical protein DCE11_03230 [Ruminiclostridium sp.]|jgi:hypothetical protein|nr:hypothetical protein [Clostridiaceae bacterium]HAA25121.1 hypothetical protein [Ruminiclostridium sp.]
MPGVKNELSRIPLPTDKDANIKHKPPSLRPSAGFSDLKEFLRKIQIDDIILIGLIILLATDDDCDNFLLVLLVFIFLSGFDKHLFPFL